MARYRKIDPRIWNDAKFMKLSDNGKLVFFFLLTHPHMTAIGAMRASIPGLAAEMGWQEKAFREAFREASISGMVSHDERHSFLSLPNFIKYNNPESPNVVKAWKDSLDLLPECPQLSVFLDNIIKYLEGFNKAFAEALPEAFWKAMAKTMPYQEQEQEQEQDYNIVPKGTHSTEEQSSMKESLPHEDIIDAYNTILPVLTTVKKELWNGERKKNLSARLKEDADRRDINWWKNLFSGIADTPFLLGENDRGWKADLGWIVKPANMVKILEGKWRKGKNQSLGKIHNKETKAQYYARVNSREQEDMRNGAIDVEFSHKSD